MDPAAPAPPTERDRSRANTPLHHQLGPRLFFAGLVFASFSAFSTRRALLRRRTPVPVMPAQARHQFAQSIKSQHQHQPLTHTTMPPPANAPATHANRPPALHAQGQTSTAANEAGASASASAGGQTSAGAAGAAAEATAPELHNSGAVMAAEALALATMNTFSWAFVAVGGALWYLDVRGIDDLRALVRGGLGVDGSGRSEQEVEEEMEEWIVSVISRKERKEKEREGKSAKGNDGGSGR